MRLVIDGTDVTTYAAFEAGRVRYESGGGPVVLSDGEHWAEVQRVTLPADEIEYAEFDSFRWKFRVGWRSAHTPDDGAPHHPREVMTSVLSRLYSQLVEDEDDHGCRELPDSACREVPGNAGRLVVGFALQKLGDRIVDSKTVLAWLLTSLGAPGLTIAMLVPIRESGSLLPQAALIPFVRRSGFRKRVWAIGCRAGRARSWLGDPGLLAAFSVSRAGWMVPLCGSAAQARATRNTGVSPLLGPGIAGLESAW